MMPDPQRFAAKSRAVAGADGRSDAGRAMLLGSVAMSTESGTITASGDATIAISTDVAWLRLVIVTEGKTTSEAGAASASRLTIVLDMIRETEPKLPEMVTEVERDLEPMFDDEALQGYRLRRVLRAQMPPEAAPMLLDVAIMAGAAPGSGIVWGLRDPAPARARVAEAALAAARGNAYTVAHTLGRVLLELREARVECDVPVESPGIIMAKGRATVGYGHRAQ